MSPRGHRPGTICIRCGKRFDEHLEGWCADGSGCKFKTVGRSAGARPQAGASFNEAEITALHTVLTGLLSKKDLRFVARSKPFASVADKVVVMRRAIERQKLEARLTEPPTRRSEQENSTQ